MTKSSPMGVKTIRDYIIGCERVASASHGARDSWAQMSWNARLEDGWAWAQPLKSAGWRKGWGRDWRHSSPGLEVRWAPTLESELDAEWGALELALLGAAVVDVWAPGLVDGLVAALVNAWAQKSLSAVMEKGWWWWQGWAQMLTSAGSGIGWG
jgi:hypothetical protein